MIKVMIVDDELLARMGISSMLARYNAEFQIVAEVDSAIDALKLAKKDPPDVIITDIKMPVMTGIDLIRKVKDAGLGCKFIILSAYSEFQYVREGLRLGAVDYFLKPELEESRLVALLRKISGELSSTSLKAQSQNGYPSEQHKVIYRLLTEREKLSDFQVKERLEQGETRLPMCNLCCVLCWFSPEDDFQQNHERTVQYFSMMESFLRNYGIVSGCIVESDIFCFLVSLRKGEENSAQPLHQTLSVALPEYMKSTVNLGVSVFVNVPRNSYLSALEFFNQYCKIEKNHFKIVDSKVQGRQNQYLFDQELGKINTLLNSKRIDEISGAFLELEDKIRQNQSVSLKILHSVCYSLVHMVEEFSQANQYLNLNWNRSQEFLYLIQKCRIKEDYLDYIDSLCERLTGWQYEARESNLITRAKEYIANNFTKDLSLAEVARTVGLNQNYFSRLFSQKTGGSFTYYINFLRVERAKKLLQSSDEQIQEIGTAVGFNSSFYFIKTFKRLTEMTPMEYRTYSRTKK